MKERPDDVSDTQVLDAVRRHWTPEVDVVEHLSVGWGGHHWRASVAGEPTLFVTLDPPTPRHTPASFEAAYASAAALGLDFVWAPVPRVDGGFTVPIGERVLSVTRWLDGVRPSASVPELAGLLAQLHSTATPPAAPVWRTVVLPDLAPCLAELLERDWSAPLGPEARALVAGRLGDVRRWSAEHTELLSRADPATYVVTHGEPGVHNQWTADGRTYLIDWESLLLAPRERDLATLVHRGVPTDADPAMVRLFDLEWRLSEIWAFAEWLHAPHAGDADDHTALGGLTDELTRPHFDEH